MMTRRDQAIQAAAQEGRRMHEENTRAEAEAKSARAAGAILIVHDGRGNTTRRSLLPDELAALDAVAAARVAAVPDRP